MTSNSKAREAALSALHAYTVRPTSILTYQSQGRIAILGDAAALAACEPFPDELTPSLILIGKDVDQMLNNHFHHQLENPSQIHIDGYLGHFTITLGEGSGSQGLSVDIVLNLTSTSFFDQQILPAGYLPIDPDSEDMQRLTAQLLDMVGVFEKPKYFNYDESLCAHSSNGRTVCTQCIDACPAQAISSLNQLIEVDPYLCQGGGSCATVCPSGAMQYVYPSLQDNGNRLRKMLQAYSEHGGVNPVVVLHSEASIAQQSLQQFDNLLPLQLEELASAGAEMWISALAYGAQQVLLYMSDEVPQLSQQKLYEQLAWCRSILQGLNLDPRSVSIVTTLDAEDMLKPERHIPAAEYVMPQNKRTAFYQAVDHLYKTADKTREVVELAAEAPFGQVIIDESRCTLCMACVGACPGKALQDGSNRELPEIFFIESQCIQCGTCTHTCPEDAIAISPRLILDREKRNQSKVLNQDTPFACISCGKPFAPTSVIHKMTLALSGHYMFNSERARNRLKMCDECRVADIVQDPDALTGNFDPLNSNSGKRLS